MKTDLSSLLAEIRACSLCSEYLPHGPRPVLQVHPSARLLIASQAPGRKVHATGIPFNDASGKRLRDWLGIGEETFYDPTQVAIVPMGFCYPGKGASGDLPPRPECAPQWRDALLAQLENIQLTVVIGRYAQACHLPEAASLTEAVTSWGDESATVIALPHPSPRNNLWLKRNPWFEAQAVPLLRARVRKALDGG
ncbi:MAG TPA: uracil-DNA glycosylase family protein [Methylophilaceae bacterium]|nr:uracil-DNA glycosylase family protein [Methylophilaceae bacterium]